MRGALLGQATQETTDECCWLILGRLELAYALAQEPAGLRP